MVEVENLKHGTELVKRGFAKMQKGGVILDVTTPEEAKIAEDAGAVAVMALEKVPADLRKKGEVVRMADPAIVKKIMDAVTIPVMAKCRIGHTTEAKILESVGADMIDESEVLTPADPEYHVNKEEFDVPFVCGCRDLGEALRRIDEGAAMIRTKGEAGTGNVIEAVRHMRAVMSKIKELKGKPKEELKKIARKIEAPYYLVKEVAELQRLPVVNFAAGGIAGPADAALMMNKGADGVFVGSGVFKSENPEERGKAIVEAVNNYEDPEILKEISKNLGKPMSGIDIEKMDEEEKIQNRGW